MGSFLDKGIIFCGCSFTWGQGLWHYSDLKNIHIPKDCNSFEFEQITGGHFKYAQKNRFARKILRTLYNTVSDKKISFLGWAFKKDTNDTRESASINVADLLLN